MEWACPTCGTRSAGHVKVCPTCGAPQPANAQFSVPDQGVILAADDPGAEKVAQAVAAGPDVQCPFCGARNAATASVCAQCQAPLAGAAARESGAKLEGLPSPAAAPVKCHVCGADNPAAAQLCAKCGAPLQRRAKATKTGAPAPLPAPHHGGVALWWLWALGALVVAAIGVFAWLAFRSENYTAVVESARWERSVEVLAFQPVEQRAWKQDVPAGAELLGCRDELFRTSDEPVAGAREVCGTPYTEDTGTGYGKVMQDCEYQVFAPKCSYQTMQWVLANTAVASGEGFAPAWPEPALEPDRKLGARTERYTCDIRVDNKQYSFSLEPENYALCRPQSRWQVQVNGLGSVVAATPEAAE